MNQLEQLKKYTKVVIDSGDISHIKKYKPFDATTNPSLILKAIKMKEYFYLIKNSIEYSKKKGGNNKKKITRAVDKIIVSLGSEILNKIPGVVSSEVDARLSFNIEKSILKAKKIISMYENDHGINRNRVLIKLAATWEGIKAAEYLEKNNIHCNLTLLFSFAQARACAESNVFLISPFVGRIYDWYKLNYPTSKYHVLQDKGVRSVKNIYEYYKKYLYKTIIMGASFRNKEQILALSGCDCLTISPELLEDLKSSDEILNKELFLPKVTFKKPDEKLSKSEFKFLHNKDLMAVEKLSEGIKQFSLDQNTLEKIIKKNM
ncbi:Transaldolase A [Buchnera aphidicola (Periphyllus testudinaceus)]|uniref:transaldolase n=1 Tax=Buchnera aphidicola TaxID=9 RepID=UPI003464729C